MRCSMSKLRKLPTGDERDASTHANCAAEKYAGDWCATPEVKALCANDARATCAGCDRRRSALREKGSPRFVNFFNHILRIYVCVNSQTVPITTFGVKKSARVRRQKF